MTSHEHESHGGKHGHGHNHGSHGRKALHRDWRLWVAVVLMLIAMGAYVLSDNEVFAPGGKGEPMPAAPAAP